MSAMPRACHPSKNSGSSSTQRRYFSTALSSSPMARSPFASSNISSRALMPVVPTLAFRRRRSELEARRAPALSEPLVEHDHPFALQVIFFEARLRLREARRVARLARLKDGYQATRRGRDKVGRITGIQFAHRVFNHGKIRSVGLLLFRFLGRRRLGLRWRSLHNRERRQALRLNACLGESRVERRSGLGRFANFPRPLASASRNQLFETLFRQRFSDLRLRFVQR